VSARPRRRPDEGLGIPPATRGDTLLDWLFRLRDLQRERLGKGAWLIKGQDVPWEHNRQGIMKWFMHPALQDTCIRSMLFYEQIIPAGSKSGLQLTPGGQCIYILEGRGYTLLDGVRHDWQAEDIVQIPLRRDGVKVQHVNTDQRHQVRFVCAELNLVDTLGVDRGAALEQLEDAPEYEG
jgi:gentisate 1,2-dioxygenase